MTAKNRGKQKPHLNSVLQQKSSPQLELPLATKQSTVLTFPSAMHQESRRQSEVVKRLIEFASRLPE